jgi:hypothetical protein
MYVMPAHFDLPSADLLTKSTANQAVQCLAQGYLTDISWQSAPHNTCRIFGTIGTESTGSRANPKQPGEQAMSRSIPHMV